MKFSIVLAISFILLVNADSSNPTRETRSEKQGSLLKRFIRPHIFTFDSNYVLDDEKETEFLKQQRKTKEMERMRENAAVELYLKLMRDLKFY